MFLACLIVIRLMIYLYHVFMWKTAFFYLQLSSTLKSQHFTGIHTWRQYDADSWEMDPELEMTSGNRRLNLRWCPLSITKMSVMESGCQSAAGLTDFQGCLLSAILYLGYEGSQCFLNALRCCFGLPLLDFASSCWRVYWKCPLSFDRDIWWALSQIPEPEVERQSDFVLLAAI